MIQNARFLSNLKQAILSPGRCFTMEFIPCADLYYQGKQAFQGEWEFSSRANGSLVPSEPVKSRIYPLMMNVCICQTHLALDDIQCCIMFEFLLCYSGDIHFFDIRDSFAWGINTAIVMLHRKYNTCGHCLMLLHLICLD